MPIAPSAEPVSVRLDDDLRVEVGPIALPVAAVDALTDAQCRRLVRQGALLHRLVCGAEAVPGEVIHGALAIAGLASWLAAHGVEAQAAMAAAWRAARTTRQALAAVVAECGLEARLGELWTALEAARAIEKPKTRWRRNPWGSADDIGFRPVASAHGCQRVPVRVCFWPKFWPSGRRPGETP